MACLWLSFSSLSCTSLSGSKEELPPEIGPQTSLEQAFDGAINFGGETLEKVKKLVATREQWPRLEAMSRDYLLKNATLSSDKKSFLNAIHLYRVSAKRIDLELLHVLFEVDDVFYQKVAWQLVALKPDTRLIPLLEAQLSEKVAASEFDLILIPEMARAVKRIRCVEFILYLEKGL